MRPQLSPAEGDRARYAEAPRTEVVLGASSGFWLLAALERAELVKPPPGDDRVEDEQCRHRRHVDDPGLGGVVPVRIRIVRGAEASDRIQVGRRPVGRESPSGWREPGNFLDSWLAMDRENTAGGDHLDHD